MEHWCEVNIDSTNAVAAALGKQADYEALTDESGNGRQGFDLYLRSRLRAALNRWTDYSEEEEPGYGEESGQTAGGSENKERIQIEIPDE